MGSTELWLKKGDGRIKKTFCVLHYAISIVPFISGIYSAFQPLLLICQHKHTHTHIFLD